MTHLNKLNLIKFDITDYLKDENTLLAYWQQSLDSDDEAMFNATLDNIMRTRKGLEMSDNN
ncbi:helix-turn-helix domain-containing protein [Actinobacillus delphinicola]|uniref:Uncharacterized protein n=1 Tax=Actinobacillus delphinicola TaxID=51161 RepID=A0A448TVT7_9PAST|nr:hypothetical protein [Actinobacillus delphinicola]VEJ10040.1 Uncharacterised protein [Actinobacillus delphinicola]